MKEKIFYQVTDFDCGLQSLKSMLYYYSNGHNFIEEEDFSHKAYTFYDLKTIAHNYDMEIDGFKVDNLDNLKPCIVQVEYEKFNHYMFFIKNTRKRICLLDPNFGKVYLKKEEFYKVFKGYVLLFKDIKIHKKKKKRKNISFIFDIVLESILALPFFLFVINFMFKKYISLFLFALILLSIFLRRIILLIRMNKFDNIIEQKTNNIKQEDLIIKLYNYKSAKFSIVTACYNYILYNFSYFFIVLNFKYGSILSLVHVIYLIIDIYGTFYKNEHIYKLGIVEKNSTNLNLKYKKMNKLTKDYILKNEIKNVIFSLLILALLVTFNQLFYHSNEFILSIFIFYLFIINRNDLHRIIAMNKNLQIGKNILKVK